MWKILSTTPKFSVALNRPATLKSMTLLCILNRPELPSLAKYSI